MSLKNIKTNLQSERGFTIVELLIVVVVIAILAAITIVSYNGITNRANDSSAKALASSVQKKAELYFGEKSGYPATIAQFNDSTKPYHIENATTVVLTTDPSATNGTKAVRYQACGTATGATGQQVTPAARITYWEYGKSTPGLTQINLGDTTANTCA